LGHATGFAKRKLHLGYRAARLLSDGVLGAKGALVRGHEFHYASLVGRGDDDAFAELSDSSGRALGPSGGRRGRVSGTFFHAIAADGIKPAAFGSLVSSAGLSDTPASANVAIPL